MPNNYPGWPKLLRDVPEGAEVITLLPVRNGLMEIPAGTRGTIAKGKDWERFRFKTEACTCCGIRALIDGLGRRHIKLI